MTPEIIDKISRLLAKDAFTEESEVVYFLVEVRKLLDRIKKETQVDHHTIIRFYADWSVHTEKSRITPAIQEIITRIDKSIPLDVKTRKFVTMAAEHIEFIYMRELRQELRKLLSNFSLPTTIFEEENKWAAFVSLLVKVLVDQPIENPTSNIKSFCFQPSAPRTAIWVIEFTDARGICKFGNAY